MSARRAPARAWSRSSLVVIAVVIARADGPRIVRDLTLPLAYADVIRQQARREAPRPGAGRRGHLRRDEVRRADLADRRARPDADRALDRASSSRSARARPRSRSPTSRIRRSNIAYGSYYLRYLLDRYGGDETLALAAYNGGETNVDGWLAQAHAAGVRFTVDAIPFAQTRAYVQRVEHAQVAYRSEYGL